jgi:hypothetical protein
VVIILPLILHKGGGYKELELEIKGFEIIFLETFMGKINIKDYPF